MSGADRAVLEDLRAENEDLDSIVAGLPAEGWSTPTPAPGWTIAHQIAHLSWADRAFLLAVTDPAGSLICERPQRPTSRR